MTRRGVGALARSTAACTVAICLALTAARVDASAPEPTPSAADVAAARAELEVGLAAYERKDFATALVHFEKAHGLDPTPESLYAWAQAARGAGDCETAVVLYRRFVDEGATGDSRVAALRNEERCKEVLASQPQPQPVEPAPIASAPAPTPVVDTPPSEPPPTRPRPRKDVAGIALVGVGAVGLVAGSVLVGVGESLRARQSDTRDYDRFDELDGRIDALHIAGGVALGIGAVLTVVGAIRLALARRRDRSVGHAPRFGTSTGMRVLAR